MSLSQCAQGLACPKWTYGDLVCTGPIGICILDCATPASMARGCLVICLWLKIKQWQAAGFGPCFHLPRQAILEFRFFEPLPYLSTYPTEPQESLRDLKSCFWRPMDLGPLNSQGLRPPKPPEMVQWRVQGCSFPCRNLSSNRISTPSQIPSAGFGSRGFVNYKFLASTNTLSLWVNQVRSILC